jgi:hypothetical protein
VREYAYFFHAIKVSRHSDNQLPKAKPTAKKRQDHLDSITERYTLDAYNSLSISGYMDQKNLKDSIFIIVVY